MSAADAADHSPLVPVVVAPMGTGVQDVVIEEWYVQVGDQVSAGQPLVLVETDKTTTEIESPVAGTVRRLLVEEGVEALVGAVIAEIAPS